MKKGLMLILTLSFLFTGCSAIKNIYGKEDFDNSNQTNQYFLKKMNATEPNKCILHFTNGFNGDVVEVVNGEEQLFKKPLKTTPDLGFAEAETISNDKPVQITIFGSKQIKFILKEKELKKYKYVFITKENDKIVAEYTNVMKKFL